MIAYKALPPTLDPLAAAELRRSRAITMNSELISAFLPSQVSGDAALTRPTALLFR